MLLLTNIGSRTLTANIRRRRGSKVAINVPIYFDTNTPKPFIDPTIPWDRNIYPEDHGWYTISYQFRTNSEAQWQRPAMALPSQTTYTSMLWASAWVAVVYRLPSKLAMLTKLARSTTHWFPWRLSWYVICVNLDKFSSIDVIDGANRSRARISRISLGRRLPMGHHIWKCR
jgi:hypothetical protein